MSCHDCRHAIICRDDPPFLEGCHQVEDGKLPLSLLETWRYNADRLPEHCGCFTPIMLGQCGVCQTEILHPAHLPWGWWGVEYYTGEGFPVCSSACHARAKANYEQDQEVCKAAELDEAEYREARELDEIVDGLAEDDLAFIRRTYLGMEA